MKATAEKSPDGFVTLEIEIEAEKFAKAVEKAYRQVVGNYLVPGFRRGKTPRPVLERFIGKDRLYEDAINQMIPEAYREAVADTGIKPLNQPKVEVSQAEEGKPVVFKARVMVEPDVKLGEYKGIEVKRPAITIRPEDVDRQLEKMRDLHAKLLTVEEGTVQEGDYLIIDFQGTIDGQPFEGGESADFSFQLGGGQMLPDFERQLTGLPVGGNGKVVITFPDSYPKEGLAGKEASFEVTVKDIKRKELAPLDDEFAKDVSEHDFLEELRSEIENRLRDNAERAAVSRASQILMDAVVERAVVDVPSVLVDSQFNMMKNDLDNQVSQMGMSMEQYLKYAGTTQEQMLADMRRRAGKDIRVSLVLTAVGRAEGISVSPDDIADRIAQLARTSNKTPGDVTKLFEEKGEIPYLRDTLLREKVLAFLREHAVYIDEDTPVE
ncbi:MAG: trigger factor [Peptococcaceae bacterium]|jgi:trigger factor|nr:trigger factor [Peptococcaceae bacterium]